MVLIGNAGAFELVSLGLGVRDESLGRTVSKQASVQAHKGLEVVQVAHGLGKRDAEFVCGGAGHHAYVATGRAYVRRFTVSGTLGHEDFAHIFVVGVFLWIHREVARVIDGCAIDGETHLIAVRATNGQGTAEQAGCVVAESVHTRQHFNGLVGAGCRRQ